VTLADEASAERFNGRRRLLADALAEADDSGRNG
jgi:hypothetical protein